MKATGEPDGWSAVHDPLAALPLTLLVYAQDGRLLDRIPVEDGDWNAAFKWAYVAWAKDRDDRA